MGTMRGRASRTYVVRLARAGRTHRQAEERARRATAQPTPRRAREGAELERLVIPPDVDQQRRPFTAGWAAHHLNGNARARCSSSPDKATWGVGLGVVLASGEL